MPLVLGAVSLFVATGLFAGRLGRAQQALCLAIAMGVAAAYLLVEGIN